MNPLIKELLLQVVPMAGEDGEYLPSLHTPEDIEKFAELIILKCDKFVSVNFNDCGMTLGYKMKKHFGIEE
jgi:hypothetical protein